MSDKKHLRIMKKTLLLASGFMLAVPFVQAQKNKDKKPNIVFILADDLGYGDLSCYGQEKFETRPTGAKRYAFHPVLFGNYCQCPFPLLPVDRYTQRTYSCSGKQRTRPGRTIPVAGRYPHHLPCNAGCRI
jgi:hypothetical protein